MKQPEHCENLQDIRIGIDAIDYQLMQLFDQRMGYVLAAAQFKPSEASISAPDRVASMMIERQRWAKELNLDQQFVTNLFMKIIPLYIETQTQHWRRTRL